MIKECKKIIISTLLTFVFLSGCGESATPTIFPDIIVFTNGRISYGDDFYCYVNLSGNTSILQYDTMTTSPLCNKPNCTHSDADCIIRQLGGTTPIFVGNYAYYFIDDPVTIIEDEETGKKDLKLATTLYRYDLSDYRAEKLVKINGISATNNCYGWLLYGGEIYLVGNYYSRTYDENSSLLSYRGNGGEMMLYSIDLTSNAVTNHGALYDLEQLQEYYPEVERSGEVYLKGVYQDRLYFEVAFVELLGDGMDPTDFQYVGYVTAFDPATGKFSDAPDLAAMDYAEIAFISEDTLVLSQEESSLLIYQDGAEEPITLEDADFYLGVQVEVYDNMLYYDGKAYDLATREFCIIPELENTEICAKYQEEYILANEGGQENFRKVPTNDIIAYFAKSN